MNTKKPEQPNGKNIQNTTGRFICFILTKWGKIPTKEKKSTTAYVRLQCDQVVEVRNAICEAGQWQKI